MTAILKNITDNKHHFLDSILNSYSQIFFSTHKPFSILIMLVSFIDIYTGLMGVLAVISTSLTAFFINLNKPTIAKGLYGFNGLLVGLGLGIYYSLSWYLVFVIILAAIFTLFISVSLQGVIGKYHLPYLSIPFLIGMWIFTIAAKHFEALGISERGIYYMNELYVVGGHSLVKVYEFFNQAESPVMIKSYFISLSAILFQYNVLTGFIIAIGLLLFSRIAFMLSVIGFSIAFGFYHMIDANITMIEYSYIGFNYILTSIAIGGFFLVPSTRSFVSVGILVPLVAILSISLSTIFYYYHLAIYSLPFNAIVLLFLYVLKFRMTYSEKLTEVYYQYNSPEKNLYTFINNKQRFEHLNFIPLKLPFIGKWTVSQGHDGEYTHQDDWRHAWDFVITNDEGKQYTRDGNFVEDYFCFNKPVTAPAEGIVEEVIDYIDDNLIGDVNLEHNWGNTVIIKHSDNVYSKLSHLKKNSIKVKPGDKVSNGQTLAKCGNSGRSPFPHLHFQIQANPYIGSTTIFMPFSNYVVETNGDSEFNYLQIPQVNQVISNTESCPLLSNAFNFIPGQNLEFDLIDNGANKTIKWEVKLNAINQTYLECTQSKAKAYFDSKGDLFYFTHYEGSRSNQLYDFYLGCFKVQKCFQANYTLQDQIPLHQAFPKSILWFHDFISPFVQVAKTIFKLNYTSSNDVLNPTEIELQSNYAHYLPKKINNGARFIIKVNHLGIDTFLTETQKTSYSLKRKGSHEA